MSGVTTRTREGRAPLARVPSGAWLRLAVLLGVAAAHPACGDSALSPEPGETSSGGDATTLLLLGSNSFSLPAPNLSSERRAPFFTGNAFFSQPWVTAPASTTARDGLGPTFHGRACSSCHFRDGRGEPPESGEILIEGTVGLGVLQPDGSAVPDPSYGGQLQPFGVPEVPGEATPILVWEEVETGAFPDGETWSLRAPTLVLEDPAFGPFAENLGTSIRMAPHVVGLGLLEAIPAETREAWADPGDADGDGSSGRLQRAIDLETGLPAIGRFGWKASQPTVAQQRAAAFSGDMGLTRRFFPDETCPPGQDACASLPTGGSPEVENDIMDKVAFYGSTLAVPGRRNVADPVVLHGRELMRELGCTGCHQDQVTTGTLTGFPELSNQAIRPYTDLLLHDMGEGLADGLPDGEASPREWRTPPLWGVGLFDDVSGHTFLLHDGRARGFVEAILWHGGEAEEARDAFVLLPKADRDALVTFLESL